MINDNLAPVLIAGSSQDPTQNAPLELRQGTVESWDPSTGEGVIQIAGGKLANISVLTSESMNLQAGDVISVLSFGDRSLILGKTTTPGDPGTVPTWDADITALQTDVVTAQTTADTAQTTATTASADAATAVSTATSAAADASAALDKFPITSTDISDDAITTPKLAADAIDGLTITGALIRTAASGQRLELDSNTNGLEIYSGAAGELQAGEITADEGTGYGSLEVIAPLFSGSDDARLSLKGFEGSSNALLRATSTQIYATDDVRLQSGDGAYMVQLTNTGLFRLGAATVLTDATVQPYYYAYLAANLTVANNTSTAIGWTDEATSPSNGITRSGSVFTVPKAGRYRVTFQAYWNSIASPAGTRLAQLYSGDTIGTGNVLASAAEQPSASAASACLVTKTVRLAAGGKIRTEVSHSQGASFTNGLLGNAGGNLTYVQVEWVGP